MEKPIAISKGTVTVNFGALMFWLLAPVWGLPYLWVRGLDYLGREAESGSGPKNVIFALTMVLYVIFAISAFFGAIVAGTGYLLISNGSYMSQSADHEIRAVASDKKHIEVGVKQTLTRSAFFSSEKANHNINLLRLKGTKTWLILDEDTNKWEPYGFQDQMNKDYDTFRANNITPVSKD